MSKTSNPLHNASLGPSTTAIHAGETPDSKTGASSPNLVMSATYVSEEATGFSASDMNEGSAYRYSRWANPTVGSLQEKIAAMEGTQACLCTASGMAAMSAIFFTVLSAGDHVIVSDVSYAGVAELVRDTLPRFGIEASLVDMSNPFNVAKAMRPNTKLVHCETPANPIIRLSDLTAICKVAKKGGAKVSCDSTFASPIATKPASFGVDYVMHSITKYIGGHGDAVGGAVCGTTEDIAALNLEAGIHHGGVLSPFNAWLIARGAATLPLRMRAHEENAMELATWLEDHPKITRVLYPGLKSHPQHDLAARQMNNYSGMISFQVGSEAQGLALAERMTNELKIFHYAVSLGHHRSLIFWMPTSGMMETSFKLEGAQLDSYRNYAGDGIFRVSVGLEDSVDLIRDLDNVLRSYSKIH